MLASVSTSGPFDYFHLDRYESKQTKKLIIITDEIKPSVLQCEPGSGLLPLFLQLGTELVAHRLYWKSSLQICIWEMLQLQTFFLNV